MDNKYEILIDGVAIAIADIAEVTGEESFDDYIPIVKKLSLILAAAAKLDSEMVNQCALLVDAIVWTISELLDSIDSGSTDQQSEILGNLAKALAEAAKAGVSVTKQQALLMAGA